MSNNMKFCQVFNDTTVICIFVLLVSRVTKNCPQIFFKKGLHSFGKSSFGNRISLYFLSFHVAKKLTLCFRFRFTHCVRYRQVLSFSCLDQILLYVLREVCYCQKYISFLSRQIQRISISIILDFVYLILFKFLFKYIL